MKATIKNPFSAITNFLSHSIRRTLVASIIASLLTALLFLLPNLSGGSWDSVYKDNLTQHKLLAASMVEPIKLQIASYQHKLKLLDIALQSTTLDDPQKLQKTINKFINTTNNVIAISLTLSKNNLTTIGLKKSLATELGQKPTPPNYIAKELRYQKYNKKNSISPVFKSILSKKPVILIKHHIFDKQLSKLGTLFAEIEPKFIQELCGNISFGDKGLCAVVDDKGRIVAHPNLAWVAQSRKLLSHPLIHKLKSSYAGSQEYLSVTGQKEMIGGYAKIKTLGWGVIVTRPKAEIDLPLNSTITMTIVWLLTGLALAFVIAILFTLKATHPLATLNEKSKVLAEKPKTYNLEGPPKNSSSDIAMIWNTLSDLLTLYQDLNTENLELKSSSKKDIRKVMSELRVKNTKKPINIDPITGLTNGAFFLEELRKNLLTHKGEIAGLILIEIDNYKPLIEKEREALANHIIKHVAQILISSTRNDDIVSRYGNAGRFAIFVNDCSPKSIQGTAKKLRSLVEVNPIQWKENTVYISLSIGIVGHKISEKTTVNTLMSFSERALMKSKSAGENKISTYKNKQIETA